jgi:hypothetical protein
MQAKIIYFNPFIDELETDLRRELNAQEKLWVLKAMEELDRIQDHKTLENLSQQDDAQLENISEEEREARILLKSIMSNE